MNVTLQAPLVIADDCGPTVIGMSTIETLTIGVFEFGEPDPETVNEPDRGRGVAGRVMP